RDVFAFGPQMLHAHGQGSSRGVVANRFALSVDPDLLEVEALMELDFAIFDPGDLGHAHDAADATAKAGLLHDEVDSGTDRLPDGARGQVLACLEDQRFQTDQAFVRVVGVKRRHRSIVARVHGLEHVEGLAATTLADDDAVRAHTQTALDQLANRHRWALEGDGRDDHVDTRAVFQARVTDGGRFVNAPSNQADDAVDDLAHLALRLEGHRREDRLAALLHVDLLWMVGHDFGDVRV